ncbi:hypothetical protein KIN20_027266 [Parelaphostrongylus tenuis]|uniref:Uncharacterized protein n=1 Tax=Parelaphostrongylus tenuis TaxID=148309 RepID=A0AAD5WDU3_PARTN|nr:hypothetical protein KIN20_027266 [Parelaphostrongylus tenuis]
MPPLKPNTNQKASLPVSDGKNVIEINFISTCVPEPTSSIQRSTYSKEAQSTSNEEALPLSCTPVYVLIIIMICFVLVIGAITAVIDMRPEFLYGSQRNVSESLFSNNTLPFYVI